MSEDRAIYIPCASGEQRQSDFLIQRRGEWVQILGHHDLLMSPKEALQAASALKRAAMAALVDSMQQSEALEVLAVAFERMNDAHD